MTVHDYPVALAVDDFVPVLLTGTALVLLAVYARRLGTAPIAAVAAVITTSGGLFKAVWKLIVALDGPDIVWMRTALFPLLSAGFLLLLFAFYRPAATRARAGLAAGLAALLAAALGASLAVGATWPAMTLTIVAVSVLTVRLIMLARADRDTVAVVLFALWQIGQYLLGPMASRAEQSIALQWVEQSFNTVAQGAFAFAAWRLSRATAATPAADDITSSQVQEATP